MKRRHALLLLCSLFSLQTAVEAGETKTVNFRGSDFDVYHCNLAEEELRMFWQQDGAKLSNLGAVETLVKQQFKTELLFATNAGMYTPEQKPQGLYIEGGKPLVPIDLANGAGNFYLKPNGVFLLKTDGTAQIMDSAAYGKNPPAANYATQSGPLLVIENKLHPAFKENSANKYIRSGVGIADGKKVVFAISQKPVNFYDFALLFKDSLGCKDALYLDGAISRAYLPALNKPDRGGQFGAMIGCFKKVR